MAAQLISAYIIYRAELRWGGDWGRGVSLSLCWCGKEAPDLAERVYRSIPTQMISKRPGRMSRERPNWRWGWRERARDEQKRGEGGERRENELREKGWCVRECRKCNSGRRRSPNATVCETALWRGLIQRGWGGGLSQWTPSACQTSWCVDVKLNSNDSWYLAKWACRYEIFMRVQYMSEDVSMHF